MSPHAIAGMPGGDDSADRLLPALPVLTGDKLAAQADASRVAAAAALTRRVAELEQQLAREQARNEGLKFGIEQLSDELRRLRDQDPGWSARS